MSNLLTLFLLPFAASLLLFIAKGLSGRWLKSMAFFFSLIPLLFLVAGNRDWLDSEFNYPWIPPVGINFHLKIDSLSLVFLYLTSLIIPVSLLASRSKTIAYPNTFFGLILFLQGLIMGFFMARDLALFTIFWESMLIPLYFLITIWGGANRQSAALKFLIYMIAGSALMVGAVFALYFLTGSATFNMDVLQKTAETISFSGILFGIFALAFAVKTPLFPFHAWLPDTYYEASTTGTILLSALLSKAGIYGFLRIGTEQFPTNLSAWSPWFLGLAIAGVFYGGFAAWSQKDYKRLLAYSSLSHVNFILGGVFALTFASQSGAILQSLNHGLTIAALFLVASWLADRLKTTEMANHSGLAKYFPKLCWITFFFALSSIALPGTNSFIGELLILFGLFSRFPWSAAILAFTVILSAIYMLRWMQEMYFGEPGAKQPGWGDLNRREVIATLPLIALILWIGIYPKPLLELINPAATKIMTSVTLEPSE